MERNALKERLMNKDDRNRHFVPWIIDISKHKAFIFPQFMQKTNK
jgi:hypothetical protein